MEDIERLLQIFRNEVTTASQAFYAWKAINNIGSSSMEIHSALNNNALSWNIINDSLQNTFLITLGRLFDIDSKAFSIHALLRSCINNIDQFSKEALRKRRIKEQKGQEPSWLNEFIKSAYIPVKKDFQILRIEISKKQKEYEDVYKPIRNKIIAHKDKKTIDNVDKLFGKTKIEQVEEILQSLYQIEMIVFNLFANGTLSKIGDFTSDEEAFVQKDIGDLLKKLKAQHSHLRGRAYVRR